jgi:hypothetical protein
VLEPQPSIVERMAKQYKSYQRMYRAIGSVLQS